MERSTDLIQETPAAADFIKSVKANIEKFRLHEGESFAHLHPAILATTDVGTDGGRFSMDELEAFGQGTEPIWCGVEHDPLIQPAGRIVAIKAFQSPVSGTGFLAGVIGQYSKESYRTFKDVGINESTSADLSVLFAGVGGHDPEAGLAYSPDEISPVTIEEMLSDAPSWVEREPGLQYRKAAVPPPILTLLLKATVLLWNPFSKKFLERSGEKAADAAAELFSWLTKTVFRKFTELTQEKVFFQILTLHSGCRIAFVIPSKNSDALTEAMSSVGDAFVDAVGLIETLASLEVAVLTFEYDLNLKKWLPLHAATQKGGIIVDRPHLIVVKELQGLSIGGFLRRHDVPPNPEDSHES